MSPYRKYRRTDPRRYATHYLSSFGRRGAALTVLGVLWIFMGIGTILTPPSEIYTLLAAWEWPRGLAWIATGSAALWFARKPQGEDAWGFLALYIMVAYRMVAYGVGAINYLGGGDIGVGGSARSIVQVITYAAVMFFIALVAGWPEPGRDPSREHDEGRREA